jgi:hypothetical protein
MYCSCGLLSSTRRRSGRVRFRKRLGPHRPWEDVDLQRYVHPRDARSGRAAARLTASKPGCRSEFSTLGTDTGVGSDSIWSRSPTPMNSDDDEDALREDQKRKLAAVKQMAGRAGGHATIRAPVETTRAGLKAVSNRALCERQYRE